MVFVILIYVLIAIVVVGSLEPSAIARAEDFALAQAAKPSLGQAGFTLVGIAAVFATLSAINSTLYGAGRLTYTIATEEALAEQEAIEERIKIQKGVYVAVTGPCLETRSEYRFLRAAGADVVGMSTVPEVIVAVHAGLRSLGFAIVTDECFPDALHPVNIEEIIAAANMAAPKLEKIIARVIAAAKL